VTWWKPEAIWFKGTYPVHVCDRVEGCRYVPATIYVVQDGVYVNRNVMIASYHIVAGFVEWHIRRTCAQVTAMVAPNKIIELSPTTQIWISDVYCLYGNNWFWLRLLPYKLREELTVEGVEAVNFTGTRVFADVPAAPPRELRHPRRLVSRPGDEEGLQNSERHGCHGGAPEAQDEDIRPGGGAGE
jgi:hypothetical protein